MSEPVHKITAFITREKRGTREILVFQHPSAGIQLPAGTVERGENIETAVIREAQEETGIQNFQIQSHLGSIKNELNKGECVITKTTHVFIKPNKKSLPYGQTFRRGGTVNYHETKNGWSRINYMEYNCVPNPQYIKYNITGWVPNDAISHNKPRHFYHLTTPDQTPERWSTQAEENLVFEPFWTPLSPKPNLVPPQAAWLDAVYNHLLNT